MIDPVCPESTLPWLTDTLPTGAPAVLPPDARAELVTLPEIDAPSLLLARHFTVGRTSPVSLIVIHTAEVDCRVGAAAAVARYFAGPTAPQASAHYVVGPELVVQCVRESDTAWHAPGANPRAIGIELTARATWSAEQWAAPEVEAMLARAAGVVAGICRRHGVPLEHIEAEALRMGVSGIPGHVDVSQAFHKSDHFDPGPHFPWAHFLVLVRAS